MRFLLTNGWNEAENCTAVLLFLKAGSRIRFGDTVLQAAYDAVFGSDDYTAEAGRIKLFRLPVDGRFITVLTAGTDDDPSAPSPAAQFRKLSGRAGTIMKETALRSIYLDHSEVFTEASEEDLETCCMSSLRRSLSVNILLTSTTQKKRNTGMYRFTPACRCRVWPGQTSGEYWRKRL